MTKDEALKRAIEALQNNQTYDWKGNPLTALDEANEKVINACKEALEQPAFNRLTEKQVEDILVGCVKPIDKGLHWDFKKLYEDLFEAITGEKNGDQE